MTTDTIDTNKTVNRNTVEAPATPASQEHDINQPLAPMTMLADGDEIKPCTPPPVSAGYLRTMNPAFSGDVHWIATTELTVNPLNAEIYGDEPAEDIEESVRTTGICSPILCTTEHRIISGHRRYEAAMKLNMEKVPVLISPLTDELEIRLALIHSNKQRDKTNEQIGREAKLLLEIEAQMGKQRMATKKTGQPMRKLSRAEKGKARDKVGAQLGVSGTTAKQSAEVVTAIDTLRKAGDNEHANKLSVRLKKSASAAHQMAKKDGLIPAKRKSTRKKLPNTPTDLVPGVSQADAPPETVDDNEAHTHALAAAEVVVAFLKTMKSDSLTPAVIAKWKLLGEQIQQSLSALDVPLSIDDQSEHANQ